jgi:hypothetical protein
MKTCRKRLCILPPPLNYYFHFENCLFNRSLSSLSSSSSSFKASRDKNQMSSIFIKNWESTRFCEEKWTCFGELKLPLWRFGGDTSSRAARGPHEELREADASNRPPQLYGSFAHRVVAERCVRASKCATTTAEPSRGKGTMQGRGTSELC